MTLLDLFSRNSVSLRAAQRKNVSMRMYEQKRRYTDDFAARAVG
jgi:hypothetical protein